MRKSRFTADDIETHFMALCEIPQRTAGDPAPPVVLNPFVGTERFIREFAEREDLDACLRHLAAIWRSIKSQGRFSDAD